MIQSHHILKHPLLSEKSTYMSDEFKRYTFLVPTTARKDEIKKAVEDLYKVKVIGVNTVTCRSRNRRMKYGLVKGKISKKAIVRIDPKDTIELV